MTKRIAAIALALILVLALFSACGTASSASGSKTGAESASGSGSAKPADGTDAPDASGSGDEQDDDYLTEITLPLCEEQAELSYFTYISASVASTVEDYNDSEMMKYYEELTNVHINFQYATEGNFTTQYGIIVAGGEYPDLIYHGAQNYSGGATAAIEDGVLIDIAQYLNYAPNLRTLLDEDEDVRKSVTLDNGSIAAFYRLYDGINPQTKGFVVRQDWLDELELDVPVTYDDYHDVLKAFTTEYGLKEALLAPYTGFYAADLLIQGYGVRGEISERVFGNTYPFYQIDGEVKFGPLESGYREYLEMMNRWYNDGLFNGDYISNPSNDMMDQSYTQRIVTGMSGIFVVGQGNMDSYAGMATDPDFKITAIEDAVLEKGDAHHLGDASMNRVFDEFVSISTQCRDIKLAMEWCDLGYTDEISRLTGYGIEGLTYNLDENGEPVFTDLILNNPDYDIRDVFFVYCPSVIPSIDRVDRLDCTFTETALNATKIWNNNLVGDYRISDFISMTSKEGEDFAEKFGDISTYIQENAMKFMTGEKSFDEYESFIGTIKDMGIDDCIAVYQAAYDRYCER